MQLAAREALSQLIEKPKPMERQRLLQAFLKGTCRRAAHLMKLGVEIGEPLFGRLVGRLLIGPLELPSPRLLVGLRQVTDDIFRLCHWQR